MMSEEQQQVHFKKVESIGYKITLLQVISIICIVASAFARYMNRDERAITDGSATNAKIDKIIVYIKTERFKDSITNKQQKFTDSIYLDAKLTANNKAIIASLTKIMNDKLLPTTRRIDLLEKRISYKLTNGMNEMKKQGPGGPVTLVPAKQ